MRFIPAVSGVQISVPPPIANMTYRVIGAFFVLLQELKKLCSFWEKVLTNAPSSCNIVQVAARHRPGKKMLLDWKRLAGADDSDKKKNKKVLDSLKEMRYNKWVAWSKAFQTKASFERQSCSLKTKQCNMNHLWFKPDVFKTSIDYEHKQSAISLLNFDFSRFRPKRLLEPIKAFLNFMESLILAQDERWRRA